MANEKDFAAYNGPLFFHGVADGNTNPPPEAMISDPESGKSTPHSITRPSPHQESYNRNQLPQSPAGSTPTSNRPCFVNAPSSISEVTSLSNSAEDTPLLQSTGSTNSSIDQFQLMDEQNNRNSRKCNSCSKLCCISCTLVIILVTLLVAVLCVGVALVVQTVPFKSVTTTELVTGDYVPLKISTKGTLTLFSASLFDLSLYVSFNVSKLAKDSVMSVHKVPCNRLYSYKRKKQFSNLSKSVDNRHHFKNCSKYSALCPVDNYVYQVKNISAYVSHYITVHPFVNGSTVIRLLVFDSDKDYKMYLEGLLGSKDAMKSTTMPYSPFNFTFSYRDMTKEQSYYFFLLKEVQVDPNHEPQWYQVSRSGVQVTYSGLDQTEPYCTLPLYTNSAVSNTCRDSFHLDEGYCYIGHLQATNETTTPDESDVQVDANIVRTTAAKVIFTFGCVLVVACSAVSLFTFIYCTCIFFKMN